MPAAHRPRLEEERGRTGPRRGRRSSRRPCRAARASRARRGRAPTASRGPTPAASAARKACRREDGTTTTGCGSSPRAGITNHPSPVAAAAEVSARSAVVRAWAGVTPAAPSVSGRSPSGPGRRPCSTRRGASGSARRAIARAEHLDPLRGPAVWPSQRCGAGQRGGAEARAQVVVGGDPQHRGGERGLGRRRHEQAVDVVGDDLARAGGAVVRHRRDAGRHRLLQHERVALAPRGQHGHAGAGPLGGHVGGGAGQLDAVLEAELADLGGEVVGARAVAPDPQRPAGDLLVDAPERVDDVLELLLRREPARR